MGVVIESTVWEPNPSLYVLLFFCCFFSIFLFPYSSNSNRTFTLFDHGISSSFLRFQRSFLLLYSLASVMEGLWSVFGEFELVSQGIGREQMVMSLCYGYAAAFFVSPFLGVLSDLIGHKKISLIFCVLHFFVGIWKRVSERPSIFVTNICLSLASTIFSFSFESLMVTQHEKVVKKIFLALDFLIGIYILNLGILKFATGTGLDRALFLPDWIAWSRLFVYSYVANMRFLMTEIEAAFNIYNFVSIWFLCICLQQGHRLDSLNDTFWLMTFFESACLIASQMFANWLIGNNAERNIVYPSTTAILAIICIAFLTRGWRETPQTASFKDYSMSFYAYIFGDKRIWLLAWAQACLHFSVGIFWILWAPTVVADGREVHLGLMYPCFLGSRMLGSTAFPWLTSGPSSLRTEDCLVYAYILLALVLSIVAYDYQEIGVLMTLFCLFHACVGLILPSLARLRTMYVPKELRGGMIGLSFTPSNAAVLISLVQGGYNRNVGNAALMSFSVLGLLTAAGCMHALKQCGKQPYHNWHKQ